jgi:outer membrane usher protein FimD/PapC
MGNGPCFSFFLKAESEKKRQLFGFLIWQMSEMHSACVHRVKNTKQSSQKVKFVHSRTAESVAHSLKVFKRRIAQGKPTETLFVLFFSIPFSFCITGNTARLTRQIQMLSAESSGMGRATVYKSTTDRH